jgi:uncharacterized membrane protein YczE
MVKLIKRLIILLIGLTIAHLGVTLFLLSNLGSDPFNVLVQGIHNTITKLPFMGFLTHGNTHMAICFLIIIVLRFVDRSYIKIGTIVCMVCGGPIIDFFTWILGGIINENLPFILRLVILAAGCVILAFGMTIVMKSDAGVGPNDLVAISISDKLRKKFGLIRIIVDFSFVVVGFLLGGVIGIGTIICAFLVGPVAEIFLPFHEKWIKKIVK